MKSKFLLKKHNQPLARLVFVFLLLTIFMGSLYSQEQTITGVVTDATTGEPVPGVTITIEGTTQGV
jgi:iron complex outermembrane receptor protein